MERLTPMKTIPADCLKCRQGDYSEVKACDCIGCSLYRYRLGIDISDNYTKKTAPRIANAVKDKLTCSIPEAAKIIGISKSKMYTVAKRADFPIIQIDGRRLVSLKGLERWVEKNTAGAVID